MDCDFTASSCFFHRFCKALMEVNGPAKAGLAEYLELRRRCLFQNQLARALTAPHLIAIGVGTTVGSGVYILVATVAREHSWPALTLSFLIVGIATGLPALCYAELASRCPSAGSAYHYSYICIGEVVSWLVGWALMLEYIIGGSAVAHGISPNLFSY